MPANANFFYHLEELDMSNKAEKLELDGKKWICENFTGKKDLQINAELGQTVYIYNVKVREGEA